MTTTTPPTAPEDASPDEPGPDRGVLPSTGAVVAGLAVTGLDLTTARQVVDLRARRRVRTRRAVLGGAAAIAVIALAVVLIPRNDPDDVVADGDRTTTTTATTSTLPLVTAPPTTLAPVTTVAPTTTAKPAPITLPPTTTTIPTTTVPPIQAITVSSYAVAGTAGSNLTLTINWTDPTPGAAPTGVRANVVWGSDVVTTPDTDVPCTPTGTPIQVVNRYAKVGQPLIQVELTRCNGTGESAQFRVNADVPAPRTGYVAMVGGAAGGRSPDAATVTAGTATIEPRTPDLGQTDTNGQPVTVLTVPAGYSGPLVFRWPDGSCQQSSPVNPATPLQPTVLLSTAACQAGTGSTVP